ncbi:hypothetical protein [Anaerorhabdus sp.]|uniref:hypothetical protein n=1 Tax=Anaerorhabdus sp. TaxID=1872524 RepID=UPI002FCCAEF6
MKFKYVLKILTLNKVQLGSFEKGLNSLDDKSKVKKLKLILKIHYPIIFAIIISNFILQSMLVNKGSLFFDSLFSSFMVVIISLLLLYLLILSLLINQDTIEIIDRYEDFYKNI